MPKSDVRRARSLAATGSSRLVEPRELRARERLQRGRRAPADDRVQRAWAWRCENARLFDETQRLLKETEQRAAELAIINSVQEGLAAEARHPGDLRPGRRQDPRDLRHAGHRRSASTTRRPTWLARIPASSTASASHPEPTPLATRASRRTSSARAQTARHQPPRTWTRRMAEFGSTNVGGADPGQSFVFVPHPRAAIGASGIDLRRNMRARERLRRIRRAPAARRWPTRMSVALENARLFDETQRLFKESEQRAAELAIINSVQQALAAELNMQGIYDAVGDKIREIFHQADVGIRIYDPQTELIHYPVRLRERRSGSPIESDPLRETRIRRARPAHARDAGHQREHGGGDREVRQLRRMPGTADGEVGGLRAAGRRRPGARGDQPASTWSASTRSANPTCACCRRSPTHERGARERAPLRRDAAPVQGERAARGRARDHQQRAAGARRRAQHAGDLRRGRRQDPRDLPSGGRGHPHLRPADESDPLSRTLYENGKRGSHRVRRRSATTGFAAHVLRTRETLVINENMARGRSRSSAAACCPGTQMEKSAVYVPLVAGDQARGLINLIDMEREHAFSESDVRLLQTLANSMSVALENARLFDETQRRTREAAALAEVGPRHLVDARPADGDGPHRAPRQGPAQRRQQRDLPARRRTAQRTARSSRSATSPRRSRPTAIEVGRGHHRQPRAKRPRRVHQRHRRRPARVQIAGTEQAGATSG